MEFHSNVKHATIHALHAVASHLVILAQQTGS